MWGWGRDDKGTCNLLNINIHKQKEPAKFTRYNKVNTKIHVPLTDITFEPLL